METNSALLHALDQGRWAALAIFVGGVVNASIDYYVCALPAFNIRGAALGTGLGFTVAALLTLGSLRKCVPGFWNPGIILFPLLASLLMVPAVRWALVFGLGQGWPLAGALFWAVGIGIVCYGLLAYSVGLFEASVFRLPPDKFL